MAVFVPLPLAPYLDFQVLYQADQGILRGIPLYDRAGQAQMVAEGAGVSVDKVFVLPFPYPPWYALATLPLALLPISIAVRMWFLLNFVMLLVSVWLLTDDWGPRRRLYSFVAAPLFLPILGALFVGQYVFPTLLGMALLVYGMRKENIPLTAAGMALLTFKPHVGILVLLASLVYLLRYRDEFGRRVFWVTAMTGIFLFAAGFIADNRWPFTYPQSLMGFKHVSQCQLCISLPLTIARLIGWGFDQSGLIAVILLITLSALFVGRKLFVRNEADLILAVWTSIALLINPYLQNYDFAFALVPIFVLAGRAKTLLDWLVLIAAFFLPWISLGLFGRAGNSALLVTVILLLAWLYRKSIDEPTSMA